MSNALRALARVGLGVTMTLAAASTSSPADASTRGYEIAGNARPYLMIVHEDGSGQLLRHLGGGRITGAGTFRAGSLPWDCTLNGNRICGRNAARDVNTHSASFTTGRVTGTVYTDGRLTTRPYRQGDELRFTRSR